MCDNIVEMRNIKKAFGVNQVLHGVDFSVKKGSIHALLGENGTGKSTLMNILGGVFKCDTGEIFIDGKLMQFNSPSEATSQGIAFIHQELTLINDLTVYENMFLNQELKKGLMLDKKAMYEKSRETLASIDIQLDPSIMVRDLNASYKQIIEIAKALMKKARIIIMDEPTSSLTDVEIENIFKIMRSLKDEGVSFVFISHKLKEVIQVCDSYTVMRDGNVVAADTIDPNATTENVLVRYMIGKDLSSNDLYRPRKTGETILETRSLSKENEFHNINLKIAKGEIVGVTGLLGDGRSEAFEAVCGCNPHYKGKILVNGKKTRMTSTSKAQSLGISYLPRNRKENGIVKDLSVSQNLSLSILKRLRNHGLIDRKKELESNRKYIDAFHIKTGDLKNSITSLSGGNQQKVVLAKAIASNPQLVVLDNPTQGVDVGAKLEIYEIIMQLAESGMSFVVLSSEAPEIRMLCDRTYVMYHGEIRVELNRRECSEESIMTYATGGSI